MAVAPVISLKALEDDPRLFLYTSLTAGSSHIITATSRLETILKANKLPFLAVDIATDEVARSLWRRRSKGKKLPGLVKEGWVVGDLEDVEEWNEFGELKDNIGPLPASNAAPPAAGLTGFNLRAQLAGSLPGGVVSPAAATAAAPKTAAAAPAVSEEASQQSGFDKSKGIALPGAAEIAARSKAKQSASLITPAKPETITSAPDEKQESLEQAKDIVEPTEPIQLEEPLAPTPTPVPAVAAVAAAPPEPTKMGTDVTAALEEIGNKPEKVVLATEGEHEIVLPIHKTEPEAAAEPEAKAGDEPHVKPDGKALEEKELKEQTGDEAEDVTTQMPDLKIGDGETPKLQAAKDAGEETTKNPAAADLNDENGNPPPPDVVAGATASTEKVEGLKIDHDAKDEDEKPQEQLAKEPEAAGKSVQD